MSSRTPRTRNRTGSRTLDAWSSPWAPLMALLLFMLGSASAEAQSWVDSPQASGNVAEDGSIVLSPAIRVTGNIASPPALSATSGSQTVIPNANIVLGGWADAGGGQLTRSVTINPAANRNTVHDNSNAAVTITFNLIGAADPIRLTQITVTEVNDNPVATDDSLSAIAEDSGVRSIPIASLLTNDNAGPLETSYQTISLTSVTNGNGGTVAINGANVDFTPAANFNGPANFTYTITDNGLTNAAPDPRTATATVSFTVTPVNDAPVAANDAFGGTEDTTLTGSCPVLGAPGIPMGNCVLDNDSDVDGDTLSAVLVQTTANGTLTFSGDGSFNYQPNADFNGTDSFTYRASDGTATSNIATVTLTITAVDDLPVAAADSYSTTEDVPVADLPVLSNDAFGNNPSLGDGPASIAVTVAPSSGGTATVDNAGTPGNIIDDRIDYAPGANFFGSDTFSYQICDLDADCSTAVVTVTVAAANDDPTLDAIANQTINEDAGAQTVNLAGITAGPGETQVLTVTATSSNTALIPNPTVSYTSPSATGSLSYTPVANAFGAATITVTVTDNGSPAALITRTFTVTVNSINDNPTISAIADATTNEDTATSALAFTVGDVETAAGSLVLSAATSDAAIVPLSGVAFGGSGASRSVTVTPAANANGGPVTITVTVTDADTGTAVDAFDVTVNAVNDEPTLATIADRTINEDAGAQTVNLAGIGVGPANETGQALTVTATSSNTALIPDPTVTYTSPDATGSLAFTPAANGFGTATITVTVQDDGLTANGGDDTIVRTFTVTVNSVNDNPTISDIANTTSLEDNASADLSFTVGDTETAAGSLTLSATSSNTALVPNGNVSFGGSGASRTVTATPAANANGTATITVTVTDADSGTATDAFTYTVTAVNDEPSFDALANQTVNEDAGAQTVAGFLANAVAGPANESGQTLSVATGNDNNALFSVQPSVALGGTLTYTPAADASGTATVTVTLSDDGGTANGGDDTFSRTFTITVNAVNDNPTLAAITDPATIDEDSGLQTVSLTGISAGGDESQALTVAATSSNTALIPDPTVSYTSPNATGSLSYTPVANAFGTATITVTVTDNGSPAASITRTFTVTVNSINDAPTISDIANTSSLEDIASAALSFSVGDVETAAGSLTLSASSSNTALVPNGNVSFGGSGASRTVTATPAANANGTATITVTVTDADSGTATDAFTYTVTAVNDAPSFDPLADQTVNEDAGAQTVAGFLANVSTGPADESGQSYSVASSATNGALFSAQPQIEPNGDLTYTPAPDANGVSTVTITVQDNGGIANGGQDTFSRTFTITVNSVNDNPTISDIANTTSLEDNASADLSFTVGDTETAAGSLTLSATSSNTALVPNGNVSFGGSGASRTVTATPAANANGTATITVTVTDADSGTAADSFTYTVTAVNDEPSFDVLADQTVNEDAGAQTVAGFLANAVAGPANESGQTLSVATSNDNNALFSVQPAVALGGTLTYTPAADASGSATVTVTLSDDGGTANGGDDTFSRTFTITVNAVNDNPTLDVIADQTVTEDAASQTVGLAAISAGAGETQGLTVTATSSNTAIVPNPTVSYTSPNASGSLSYQPAANAFGTATITVTVTDDGSPAASTSQQFTVTVTEANDAPDAVDDAPTGTYNEDQGPYTFTSASLLANDSAGPNESGQALSITAAGAAVGGTVAVNLGNVVFTPSANFNGAASFTYTITDNGTTAGAPDPRTDTATVNFTIAAVNDNPTLDAIADPAAILEDAAAQTVGFAGITAGPADESGQVLTVAATSSNTALIPNPTVAYTSPNGSGSLSYTPVANAFGTAVITVTVTDNGSPAASVTRTFTVTVTAVNDAPTFTTFPVDIPSVLEDSTTGPLAIVVTDVENDPVTIVATTGNQALFPNANVQVSPQGLSGTYSRSITFTTATDQNSVIVNPDFTEFNVTVIDQPGAQTTQTFRVDFVTAVNDAPQFTGGANQTVAEDAGAQSVSNWATAFQPGPNTATDENGQTLAQYTVTQIAGTLAFTTAPAVANTGTLTYQSAPNANGSATFEVRAIDNGNGTAPNVNTSAPRTLVINVTAVNDAPVAANGSATTNEDTPVAATVSATDVDGDALTYAVVTGPANGTLTGTGPNWTYVPNPNFFGSDSFTFRANDGTVNSNTATFSLTVVSVNDAPVAANGSASTNEDVAVATTLSATDVENDPLSWTIVSGPANGSLSGTAPNLTYTPNANFNGSDSFTFRANDGQANSNVATFTIAIAAVNDAPVAANGSATTNEDTSVAATASATDVDGNPLTYAVVTGPTNGTLTGTGPNWTYVPNLDFSGSDSFTFRANDGTVDSNIATFSLTVTAVNDAPVGVADAATTAEDAAVSVNVLANDTDVDNTPAQLTVLSFTQPANGAVARDGALLRYTPNANFNGADSFTYIVSDGSAQSAATTVSLTVTAVNDAPVANNGSATTNEDTSVAATASATDVDGDTLAYAIVAGPTNGTLTGTGPNWTYVPNPNYFGSDSFTFRANDGTVDSNIATFSLTVTAVNDAPVGVADSATTPEDTAISVNVLGNDTDVDNTPAQLTVLSFTAPTNGTVARDGALLRYTPNANYNGADSFTYIVSDGSAQSAATTVSLTVTAVNDAPVAVNDAYTLTEDQPLTIAAPGVLGNDTDIDSAPASLTAIVQNAPATGTLALNANGGFTYTPNANFKGSDSFTYFVSDGSLQSTLPATVTLTVNAVNDAPTITAPASQTVLEDQATAALAVAIGDIETAPAALVLTASSGNAAIVPNANIVLGGSGTSRTVTVTPAANANGGPVTITLTVTDAGGLSTNATFNVTVTPVNDAPTFIAGPNQTQPPGTGTRTVPNWATAISAGPANESGQVLLFTTREITDASNVVSSVSVTADGTLVYELTGAAGVATIGVRLSDNGGTVNGGVDTSAEQTFTITVGANADLSAAMVASFNAVDGLVNYTITISNAGPTGALGATVANAVPAGLTGYTWSCTGISGGVCPTPASGAGAISASVDLPANGSVVFSAQGTFNAANPPVSITNTASVTAPPASPDNNLSNNSITRTLTIPVFANGFESTGTVQALDKSAAGTWGALAIDGSALAGVVQGRHPVEAVRYLRGGSTVVVFVRGIDGRVEARLAQRTGKTVAWQGGPWVVVDGSLQLQWLSAANGEDVEEATLRNAAR